MAPTALMAVEILRRRRFGTGVSFNLDYVETGPAPDPRLTKSMLLLRLVRLE